MIKKLRKFEPIGTISYVNSLAYLPEKFSRSYGDMRAYNERYFGNKEIYYDKVFTSWLPKARNDLVKQMYGDWIFFLDTDLEFEPDSFVRLLKIMQKYDTPVLSGLYVYKKEPHFPIISSWNDVKEKYEMTIEWPKDAEIIPIDGAGAGCLLIKKWVFSLIYKELHQLPFEVSAENSEDMSFFKRLRKVGVQAYCAPQVQFGHADTIAHYYDPSKFENLPIARTEGMKITEEKIIR